MSIFKSDLFLSIIVILCFVLFLAILKGPVTTGAENLGNAFETQTKAAMPPTSP
ncbi:hypothetical protein P4645_15410 [Lysinibacillus fusiformis]|uniref:hypothetical protein n=1 Tax=Lysinibacillus fusiformis TaxID=28031 RepID=UPI002E1AD68E|nr:hypothetical protein [Lysinibacillus fusiformis]